MAQLHVKRIENRLLKSFRECMLNEFELDLSKEDDLKNFYSKALSALYIKTKCECTCREAVKSITDGFDDFGLDAINVDKTAKTIFLIQSKFITKGTGAPSQSDILKFIEGFELLVQGDFDKFNEKIKSRETEILNVIHGDDYKIELVIAHTGANSINPASKTRFEELRQSYNDITDTLNYSILDQNRLYEIVMSAADGDPINLHDIGLNYWGQQIDPFRSFYGHVEAATVASWWKSYGVRLLIKNIRKYKGDSGVNTYIKTTLTNRPENFWYFNNGITIICRSVKKALRHSNNKDFGIFNLYDAQIVNGAQTFGCIGETYRNFPDKVSEARVFVKFIELEGTDDSYAKEVTRYTNTQNRIVDKDFAALDPEQERIRKELILDNIQYVFKTGEKISDINKGFDLHEATAALACAQPDIDYAAMVKGEIGKFWLDIDKPPYITLFNKGVSGQYLWRLVQLLRIVDLELLKQKNIISYGQKANALALAGNRIVAHKVFQYLPVGKLREDTIDFTELVNKVRLLTLEVFRHLIPAHYEYFGDEYIQNVFKNKPKNRRLSIRIDHEMGVKDGLFSDEE